jgi:hypothetical protein
MVLLLALFSAFGVSAAPGDAEMINQEREVLNSIRRQLVEFTAAAAEIDSQMANLRNLMMKGQSQAVARLAGDLQAPIRSVARRWLKLNQTYSEAVAKGLELHRHTGPDPAELEEFKIYMSIRKNLRHGEHTPLALLISAWRGLEFGEKVFDSPGRLEKVGPGPFHFRPDDLLLIMTVNGGYLRGRMVGWTRDGRLVLRESLPLALSRVQKEQGHFRLIDPSQAARIEIIRRPRTISVSDDVLPPAVGADGDYNPAYVRPGLIQRLEIQPSDVELLRSALQRKAVRALKISVATVDLAQESRPAYSEVFFLACELFLKR